MTGPVSNAHVAVVPSVPAGTGSGVGALLSTCHAAGAVMVNRTDALRSGWSNTAYTRFASATANSV